MTKLTLLAPARCVAALLAMVLAPLPPRSIGKEDDAHSTNTNSSSAMLAHTVCRALKACALLDRLLAPGCAAAKMKKATTATTIVQSWITHRIGIILPPLLERWCNCNKDSG